MSTRTVYNVWQYSRHKGADLLVLLKLADFADPSGQGTFPPFSELMKAARISEHDLRCIVQKLAMSGEFVGRCEPGSPYYLAVEQDSREYARAG
jgi:hypothetical protein